MYLTVLAHAAYMKNWFSRTMVYEKVLQNFKITWKVAVDHAYQLDAGWLQIEKEKGKRPAIKSFRLFCK